MVGKWVLNASSFLTLSFLLVSSLLSADEINLGDISVVSGANNTFVLKKGEEIIIREEAANLWSSDYKQLLMSPFQKVAKVDKKEFKEAKKLSLSYEKAGLGSFSREVILLPGECLIIHRWKIMSREGLGGEISFSVPEETIRGKSFEVVDYSGIEFGGVLGERKVGVDFQYHPRLLKFPTAGFSIEWAYNWAYDWGGRVYSIISKFADGRGTYPLDLGFVTKPGETEITAVMRIRFEEEKEDWEEWTLPHDYKGIDDYCDLTADKFTFLLRRNKKHIFPGERVKILLEYFGTDSKEKKFNLNYQLLDYYDNILQEGPLKFSNEGKLYGKEVIFDSPIEDTGMYRLKLFYSSPETGIKREKQAIFAVLPRTKIVSEDTVFAMHLHLIPDYTELASNCGVGWTRLWHYSKICWRTVELEEGRFVFDEPIGPWYGHIFPSPDEQVALAEKYNLKILAVLDLPPEWLNKVDYDSKEFIRLWLRYVKEVVSRYKGRVHAYEVLNEPFHGGRPEVDFSEHPEIYMKLLKETYTLIKSIDPGALVVGFCGPHYRMDLAEKLFSMGSLDYMDILSVHYIISGDTPDYADRLPAMLAWVDKMRDVMKEHGKVIPIWNTEETVWLDGCFYEKTPPYVKRDQDDDRKNVPAGTSYYAEASERVVKSYLAYLAKNVKYFYFSGFHGKPDWFSLCEADHTPTPSVVAYAVAGNLLQEAKFKNVMIGDKIQAYFFEVGESSIACYFGYHVEGKGNLILPISKEKVKAVNIMGNKYELTCIRGKTIFPFSREPVYLVGEGVKVENLISAFRKARIE